MDVRDSYDSAAESYADHLFTELEQKPLDRHLLNRFAEGVSDGDVLDLGCGPGHVAAYLHDRGVSVRGIDLSPDMIRVARTRSPNVEFGVGDMLALEAATGSVAGVVALYSIIHFERPQLDAALREIRRVLRQDGLALISFHIGDEVVHVDDLFGAPVSLDFRFHDAAAVTESLRRAQMRVLERVEREPYAAEYSSRRCYLLATAEGEPHR